MCVVAARALQRPVLTARVACFEAHNQQAARALQRSGSSLWCQLSMVQAARRVTRAVRAAMSVQP